MTLTQFIVPFASIFMVGVVAYFSAPPPADQYLEAFRRIGK